jgi:hypothetical protein
MYGGKNQEPWMQKVYLGFLLTDPTKKPNISISLEGNKFLNKLMLILGFFLMETVAGKPKLTFFIHGS